MITDGRYYLRAHDETRLWRYDRRWRRIRFYEPREGEAFTCVEGNGAVLVQSGDAQHLVASVHTLDNPAVAVATAIFENGKWTFDGEREAWILVEEHVLVPLPEERVGLLRIADGAVLDDLEDLAPPTTVIGVPDSRLIVLAGSGAITVYDPKAKHAGVRLHLSKNSLHPQLRFRNGDAELWVSDADTLIKMETRNWQVLDAAGSAVDEEQEVAPELDAWTFSPEADRVLIVRHNTGDVIVADAVTMDLLATFKLNRPAVDIAESAEGQLIAVDKDGKLPRARLQPSATVVPQAEDSVEKGNSPL